MNFETTPNQQIFNSEFSSVISCRFPNGNKLVIYANLKKSRSKLGVSFLIVGPVTFSESVRYLSNACYVKFTLFTRHCTINLSPELLLHGTQTLLLMGLNLGCLSFHQVPPLQWLLRHATCAFGDGTQRTSKRYRALLYQHMYCKEVATPQLLCSFIFQATHWWI